MFQLSPQTVSHLINDEFVVVELHSGVFHYFSSRTAALFEFFAEPASLEEYYECFGLSGPEERRAVKRFVEFCVREKLMVRKKRLSPWRKGASDSRPYERPLYLRRGKKTLSDLSFVMACPTACTTAC